MKSTLLTIVIDGPNIDLLNQWLAAGKLPVIGSVMANGMQSRHVHTKRFRNDRCWDIFLCGNDIEGAGSTFEPSTYDYDNDSHQREHRFAPFYALGEPYRTCVFDLPATVSNQVYGLQLFGWGSELNVSMPVSSPADLMEEIQTRYGADPKLTRVIKVRDHKSQEVEYSYVIPNLYDSGELQACKRNLLTAIERRTDICLDLMSREIWDLTLFSFPEMHTANHLLWHVGERHPVNQGESPSHALLEISQAIDAAIGRLAAALPGDSTLAILTLDHTASNSMDVPTMAILPEMLYRWSFPGQALLAPGIAGMAVPPLRRDYTKLWKHEIWALLTDEGRELLESPEALERSGSPFSWNPAIWYRRLWPSMKAFALPSVSDGYIRINVEGRETNGLVRAADYSDTLESISTMLQALTNPRTGAPAVKMLTRTRSTPFDLPAIPPDLVVSWNDDSPADCMDSPTLGRVNPLPYFRTGGHLPHGSTIEGWFTAQGPTIAAGTITPPGKLVDVPATLLALLGASCHQGMTGRSLLGESNALALPANQQ